jgi:hypothetical protein
MKALEFVPFGDDARTPSATKKCHEVPAFGCKSCIDADRDAWAKKTYDAWVVNYNKAPKLCPRHKKPLKPFTYHWQDGTKLIGIAGCQILTEHGEFLCEDEDDCVVLG